MGIRGGAPPRTGEQDWLPGLNRRDPLVVVDGQFDRDTTDALPEFGIDEESWVCVIHGNRR